jgi:ApbE superfamily uncharacterized protein (UPF0280 family)
VIDEPSPERSYRGGIEPAGLTCYSVVIGESDLYICTEKDSSAEAQESLGRHRTELEEYLARHLSFGTSFKPVPMASEAPGIVAAMAEAAESCDVGPMASVAGAIAQSVGSDLLAVSARVIVENGGDLFLAGGGPTKVRIFAGAGSPPVDILVEDAPEGVGLCTSSATVGPSVSLGATDAVTVLARTATLADAAATAIGNTVFSPEDIGAGLKRASSLPGVSGAVIMLQGSMGAWGKLEIA